MPAWQNNWILNFLSAKCRICKTLEGQRTCKKSERNTDQVFRLGTFRADSTKEFTSKKLKILKCGSGEQLVSHSLVEWHCHMFFLFKHQIVSRVDLEWQCHVCPVSTPPLLLNRCSPPPDGGGILMADRLPRRKFKVESCDENLPFLDNAF